MKWRVRGTPTKYGARATMVDGYRFHSAGEARRYGDLKLAERGNAIRALILQPRYPLIVNDQKIGDYVADFEYREWTRGASESASSGGKKSGEWVLVTEDFKGVRTPLYRLKKKLFRALYGREIRETE